MIIYDTSITGSSSITSTYDTNIVCTTSITGSTYDIPITNNIFEFAVSTTSSDGAGWVYATSNTTNGITTWDRIDCGNGGEKVIFLPLTKEEKIAQRVELSKLSIERRRVNRGKRTAERKARKLLKDLIGKNNHDIYHETGRLIVSGEKFDYILNKGGLIQRIESNKLVDMCVHLKNRYKFPKTDNVIAMMLSIQHQEKEVLEMANDYGEHELPVELPIAARC